MKISDQKGFTILELILVISIIAILASIALPSYENYMMKSRRDDARHLLLLNAQRLQRCFTLEGVYNGTCSTRTSSENGYYTLTNESGDIAASTFKLTVSPVAGSSQANDSDCQSFIYEHTGKRSATGDAAGSCW